MRRFSLFCAIAASLLLVQSARAVHVISVLDGSFEPDYVFINAGDTVQWQFDGNLPHSTLSLPGQAESWESPIKSFGLYEHTFNTPGEYFYISGSAGDSYEIDSRWYGMKGTINVSAIPEPAALGLLSIGCLMGLRRRS